MFSVRKRILTMAQGVFKKWKPTGARPLIRVRAISKTRAQLLRVGEIWRLTGYTLLAKMRRGYSWK
jgi:hypothetical protein